MTSRGSHPLILDKNTDDDVIKRIKDGMRRHLDDYLDFAEKHPELAEAWKNSRSLPNGEWESEAHFDESVRIRRAAYDHFMARHPQATPMELSQAYAGYSCLAHGYWVESER